MLSKQNNNNKILVISDECYYTVLHTSTLEMFVHMCTLLSLIIQAINSGHFYSTCK